MLVSAVIALLLLVVILTVMAYRFYQRASVAESDSEKYKLLANRSNEHNETLFAEFQKHRRHNVGMVNCVRAAGLLFGAKTFENDQLQSEMAELRVEVDRTAENEMRAVEKSIVETIARPDIVLEKLQHNKVISSASLWRLEKLRSERVWRAYVSVNPVSDASPFNATEDLARLCVEVEAAALREELGSETTVEWNAKPVDDPAQAHMMVRVAQEMLALAAKSPGVPKVLVVTDKPEVSMSLTGANDDVDIDLTIADIDPMLVSSASNEGLKVSVTV